MSRTGDAPTPPPGRRPLRGLHKEVVNALGEAIGRGDLQPGTSINAEWVIKEYGVSRTVVREAFKVLESKGMVVPKPRIGTRVADQGSWDVLDHDVILWQLGGNQVPPQLADLLALRASIEPMAARSLARLADSPSIGGRLMAVVELMSSALEADDFDGFCRADTQFHSMVIGESNNPVFQRLSGTVTAVLEARKRLDLMPEDMSEDVIDQHRRITEAIVNGESWDAENLTRSLIDHAGEITDNEVK